MGNVGDTGAILLVRLERPSERSAKKMEDGLSLIMSGNYKAGFADFQASIYRLWSQLVTIDWTDIGTQIDTEIQQGVADHKSDILKL